MNKIRPISYFALLTGGAVVGLIALVVIFAPLEKTRFQRCSRCRTCIVHREILGITVHRESRESRFTKFYRSQVEPAHIHVWDSVTTCKTYIFTKGCDSQGLCPSYC